mmetsp:Transcript_10598/g.9167  ORF Transcript_10598/g.9167 Transcript_10598/m.9167 type:complete len:89 (+) Transcript_10598:297-563(+)
MADSEEEKIVQICSEGSSKKSDFLKALSNNEADIVVKDIRELTLNTLNNISEKKPNRFNPNERAPHRQGSICEVKLKFLEMRTFMIEI